jgi:Bacterial PH domain/GYF domain 2
LPKRRGAAKKKTKSMIQDKLAAHLACAVGFNGQSFFSKSQLMSSTNHYGNGISRFPADAFSPPIGVMSILIYKNEQQAGPFDLATIQHAIEDGQVTGEDFAWREGCADWVPLRTLLPGTIPPSPSNKKEAAIAGFTDDEQDAEIVEKIVMKAKESMTPGEEIKYIGVQKKPLRTIAPDAVVLTNKRLLIVRTKSMDIEEHEWQEVSNVQVSEQLLTATITCAMAGGRNVAINSIPKKQARKIYACAQEVEEKQAWWEQRGW